MEQPNDEFSNIVTPPDVITNTARSVVLVDPAASEIEAVAYYLKTAKEQFNVYVYLEQMDDLDWLKQVRKQSAVTIVNTVSNGLSTLKDKLIDGDRDVLYYGPKNFLMNRNHIDSPLEYFINLEKETNVTL